MGFFRIEDGKGRGRFASVSMENLLEVSSITTPIVASASKKGDAFGLVGEHTIQVTDTEENVAYIRNGNSSKYVYFTGVTLAVDASAKMQVSGYFNVSRTSGGLSIVPAQLNQGSAKESGVQFYDNSTNDLVLVTTAQKRYWTALFSTIQTASFPIENAIILGPGDTIRVTVKGTATDMVYMIAFVYECNPESS